ncbi:ComEC/Rec2 family competence protein [Bdellovibrio reynosensis]|uniref:ComEC/Rec2 family competence protein n=1 Tax=Bdellovibrio reynosensis TaxID=2835041 RepID=A0ABY4CDA0_9BACT|nr:ComEC/Rec2 family competence protein [Bdellovibrio reynosensis]UOF01651.1 ComEC/Rec2 family competence protein [Bdellovibrio reynosensis]
MAILLILAFVLSIPLPTHLHDNASAVSQEFHKKCIEIIPHSTQHASSLAALVCGEKITDEKLKANLSKTSLIHIFVISGSHLILLDQLLGILKIPLYLRFVFLGAYALFGGWQAPAVRALLGFAVRETFAYRKIFFPADLIVLITGFTALFLFQSYWQSLSFLMSWSAALALSVVAVFRVRNSFSKAVLSQFAIYFFMLAPLWGIGSLHPLSILYNLCLAPVVSFVLLPLSFFTVAMPPLAVVFDSVMNIFGSLLPLVAEPVKTAAVTAPTLPFLWLWLLGLHLCLHFLRLKLWQGKM